jgi:hypothetical protein
MATSSPATASAEDFARELALPLLIIVNARPHSDGQYIDADSTSIPGRDAIVAASESHARPWFCAA